MFKIMQPVKGGVALSVGRLSVPLTSQVTTQLLSAEECRTRLVLTNHRTIHPRVLPQICMRAGIECIGLSWWLSW